MPIPKITHQQFAVLACLAEDPRWGRDVRARLKEDGYSSTNASFYEMMYRLETAKLVKGFYRERDVQGQKFKERRYAITSHGLEAYDEVTAFYAHHLPLLPLKVRIEGSS